MSADKEEVTFSLNVMINEDKTKVLFAETDNHFVDILLSFLTFPLGRIIKLFKKHYGDEAPTIGSLSSLYRSLANLDISHFVTVGAKKILLNPISSFDAEIEGLKLDISDSPPAEYFYCTESNHNEFRSVSIYYDELRHLSYCCNICSGLMKKKIVPKSSETASSDGVFAIHKDSFIISDDLQIFPNEMGISGIVTIVGIADMDKAELIKVDLGFSEIMNLLKASLTSPTPLSDLILNKNSSTVESQPKISLPHIAEEENANSRALSLKVIIQKSTGKFLYAQAKEDFVEFLFSFLHIPLGGVEHLLGGKTCVKAIDNLYRSTADPRNCKYFKSSHTKKKLMESNLPHGCISQNHILPLTEESLPPFYLEKLFLFSSLKFPNGQGRYLRGPRTYQVKDDLTVLPFCIVSILSSLREKKISISDAKEMELQIGLKEACSILKASLTSTTALTDALLTHKSLKQPKREED